MNTTAPNAMLLIPSLICLLGIGIGIVAAFRKRDARLPLGIGGVAFVVLYILSRPRWVQPPSSASLPIVHLPTGSTITPHEMFATRGFLLLILVMLIGFRAVIAAVRHKRIGTLAVVSALIVAAFFVVGFSATSVRIEQTATATRVPGPPSMMSSEVPIARAKHVAATPSGPEPSKIEYIVGNGPGLPVAELPEWRKNPPQEGVSGQSKYVLTSQQFATVDEAEAELFQSVTTDIQSGFGELWPQTRGWIPSRSDIESSGLITEKVVETIPLKVGEFETPVYRASWLVEFRPAVHEALQARWRPLEAERRSHWLLAGLAGITGLMGGTAILLRRQRPNREPESNPLA